MLKTRITTFLVAVTIVFVARVSNGADGGVDECTGNGVGNEGYQSSGDWDDDGLEDSEDSCPFDFDVNPADDQDSDMISDACDNCPLVENADQLDMDRDGIGDLCDNDVDGDLLLASEDNCPGVFNPAIEGSQPDLDQDDQGDVCDDDVDDDGVPNLMDACPFGAGTMMDGGVGGTDGGVDGGTADAGDSDGGVLQPDLTELECMGDSDGDGVYNYVSVGSVVQKLDNCPSTINPEQEDLDGDGQGDVCDPDVDGDGVMESVDNCGLVSNPEQEDADRDLVGDACDEDFCYTVLGDIENCLDPEAEFTVHSPGALDVKSGDLVRLRLFANREDATIDYHWYMVQGSSSNLKNSTGQVDCSTPYEYHYLVDEEPTFAPTGPGTYILALEATMIGDDQVTGETNPVAEPVTVTFQVSGSYLDSQSGCACSFVGSQSSNGFALLLILALSMATLRLRRRRRS